MLLKKLASYENGLVVVLGLTFGVVFFDRGAIGVLMPFIVKDLHLTASQVGIVGGALSLTWAVANFLAGRASDLSGRRKPLLIFALVAFSVCTIGSGLAGTFATLLAARLLMGAAQGPAAPLVMVLAAEGSSPARRGLNSGLIGSFNPLVAGVIGPVLLVSLAAAFGWRTTFFIAGIPGLVMAVVVTLFVRETGAGRASALAARANTMPVSDVLRTRNIWVCTLCCSCLAGYASLLMVFMPLYLVQTAHIEPAQIGVLLSIAGAGSLIAGNFTLALSDRVGHKPVVMAAGFAAIAAPLGVLFFADSLATLGLLLAIGMTAMFTMPLLFMAIPAGSLPAQSLGTAMGLITGVAEILGSAATPAISGWVTEYAGASAPFYICVGLALAWGSLALLLRETRQFRAPVPLAHLGG